MGLQQHAKGSSVMWLLQQQGNLKALSSAVGLQAEENGTPKGQNVSLKTWTASMSWQQEQGEGEHRQSTETGLRMRVKESNTNLEHGRKPLWALKRNSSQGSKTQKEVWLPEFWRTRAQSVWAKRWELCSVNAGPAGSCPAMAGMSPGPWCQQLLELELHTEPCKEGWSF